MLFKNINKHIVSLIESVNKINIKAKGTGTCLFLYNVSKSIEKILKYEK
jgi:hypothetical protein